MYLSVAARKICLSRSVPEIHKPVAGTVSNQPTNKQSISPCSWVIDVSHQASFSAETIARTEAKFVPTRYRTLHGQNVLGYRGRNGWLKATTTLSWGQWHSGTCCPPCYCWLVYHLARRDEGALVVVGSDENGDPV